MGERLKADKDYVYNGAIYLTGAEMPEGWVRPPEPKADPGVTMFGPQGVITQLPGVPLPPNVTAPAAEGEKAPEGNAGGSEAPPATTTQPEGKAEDKTEQPKTDAAAKAGKGK